MVKPQGIPKGLEEAKEPRCTKPITILLFALIQDAFLF